MVVRLAANDKTVKILFKRFNGGQRPLAIDVMWKRASVIRWRMFWSIRWRV